MDSGPIAGRGDGGKLAHQQVMRACALAAAVCACWLSATSAGASPITDGGFESGSLGGWTVTPAATGSFIFVAGHAHSGADAAWFGAYSGIDDSIEQTFATNSGDSYTVSFWLEHGATDNRNGFNVWWDTTSLLLMNNSSQFGQTLFTRVVTATAATTTIRFSGHALQDYYYLDDVAVTPIPAPEPSSVLLLLGGIAASWRRFRRTP